MLSMKVRDRTRGLQAASYSHKQGLWRNLVSLSHQQTLRELKEPQVEVPVLPGMIILPGGNSESGRLELIAVIIAQDLVSV